MEAAQPDLVAHFVIVLRPCRLSKTPTNVSSTHKGVIACVLRDVPAASLSQSCVACLPPLVFQTTGPTGTSGMDFHSLDPATAAHKGGYSPITVATENGEILTITPEWAPRPPKRMCARSVVSRATAPQRFTPPAPGTKHGHKPRPRSLTEHRLTHWVATRST